MIIKREVQQYQIDLACDLCQTIMNKVADPINGGYVHKCSNPICNNIIPFQGDYPKIEVQYGPVEILPNPHGIRTQKKQWLNV